MTGHSYTISSPGVFRRPSILDITSRPHTVSGESHSAGRLPSISNQGFEQPLSNDLAAPNTSFPSTLAQPETASASSSIFPDNTLPTDISQSNPHKTERRRMWRPSHNSEDEHLSFREALNLNRFPSKRVGLTRKTITDFVEHSLHTKVRRSSTPYNMGGTMHPSSSTVQPPPASPTKRNGRHASDASRSKKFRLFSDRKDTPAPVSSHNHTHGRRPLSRSTFSGPVISSGGGEGARRAAANSNNRIYSATTAPQDACLVDRMQLDVPSTAYAPGFQGFMPMNTSIYSPPHFNTFEEDDVPVEESLRRHRARLGSMNSAAADSGADLSTYSEASSGDCGTDMEIDSVMEEDEPKPERHVDFTTGHLPSEICMEIFGYLDAADLKNAMCMNKRWHTLAKDRLVWRSTYLRKYGREIYTDPPPVQVGGFGVGRPNRPNQQWQRMYKARLELDANWRKGAKDAGKAVYLSGHTDSVYCLQFDEEKIITGSRDRTIRVWDINTFQCLRVIGGPNVRPALGPKVLRTVDYPSFHMATASVNGTNYGNSIYHVPWTYHDASILCLQYDDKILVTGSSDSDLLIWDIKTYQPIRRLTKHSGGVLDVALDAKHIVSCSKDSRIIVWDRETYEPKAVLSGHRGPVNAVQLRGNLLVSASGDGIARLWDLNTMKLTKEFSAKERGLAAVEFSEDMKHVLAGGNDHITYKFETETGKEVAQFVGHTQLVRSLWLDSANKRVVSGSYDLDLRVYDFETGQEIWRAEEWTTSWMLAAKSDYRRIVAASQDGRILLVDFGIVRGGKDDGELIPDVNLLRGLDKTNEVEWRPIPW